MRTIATLVTGALVASVAQAQVVQWDIVRRHTGPKLTRRTGTFTEIITNEKLRGGYFASCSVGTPAQNLTLQLDTGSSDIWVPSSSASVCEQTSSSSDGCSLGSFDESASSSTTVVGENEFSISYVDGSHSKGDYITETFEIGGAKLTNMTMGLGLSTDIPYGLVGVGYTLNEAIIGTTHSSSSQYDNLPVLMQKQGLIATNAYSLWLNDLDASTGSILFGGIDTEKYHGDLTRIDVQKDSSANAFTSFIVSLTSLLATSSSGTDTLTSTTFPIPVVLDSGTTFSYVPTDLAEEMWKEVGAEYYSEVGLALLPCSMENSAGHFSFGFGGSGGPVINITMDELVLPLTTDGSVQFPSGPNKGQDACQFGVQNFSSDSTTFLLGDTFMRSAYVVYDLVNNQIGLAPTDFNATATNVVAFASEGAQIPSATAAPNQASVSQSASSTSGSLGASGGFINDKSSDGASLPPALDWSRIAVMGASMSLVLVGSGFFML